MRLQTVLLVFVFLILNIGCSPERNSKDKAKVESAPQINQSKFEAVNRAAKAIEGSIAVGINYRNFQASLQALATEILIAKDKMKSQEEKDMLGNYSEVLSMYKDSLTLWQHKINDRGEYDYITGKQGTIVADSEVHAIAEMYNLSMAPNESGVMLADEGIQTIWGAAQQQLEKTNALF